MMKAQCLQETQQWIGGAIESSIPRGEHSVYRIQYPVPQSEKKPRVEFPVEAINWVRLGIDNKQDVTFYPSIDNIEETAAAIADPRVRAKWDNTHAFVKHMLTLG